VEKVEEKKHIGKNCKSSLTKDFDAILLISIIDFFLSWTRKINYFI